MGTPASGRKTSTGRAPARGTQRAPPARLLDVTKYGGKWIATHHGKVVATGRAFADVDTEVRRMGLENDVILTRVPRSGAVIV